MPNSSGWRSGAKAELSTQFYALLDEIALHVKEEKEARERKEAAHAKAKALADAASMLGIVIEGFEAAEEEAEKPSTGAPTAREIALTALRQAYPKPLKAIQVREIIEQRMGRRVHTKTPGMTLYRLAEEGLVRREGHSWFAVEGDQLSLEEPTAEELMEG